MTERRPRTEPQSKQITIDVDLHDAQMEIFGSPARFIVCAAGRRFGKTVLCSILCLIEAIDNPGATVWWVAPTTRQARIAFRHILKMLPKGLYHQNNTLMEITLANGSSISFRSAERFDNLRGEGVDFLVVDEAAIVAENAWVEALRPTLSDRGGKAMFISTFKGENWFYKLHTFAQNPDNDEWQAFTFPTSANPYIPASEIDAARRSMPREKFLQEYEASPMSFVGAIFDGELLAAAAERGAPLAKGIPPARYVEAGLDWGWHVTALEVCIEDAGDRISWVHEHVFEHVELNKRCQAIADICKRFQVQCVYADAAGASENVTLAVAFEKAGLRTEIQPVPFNIYKDVGIQTRRYYLENNLEDISPVCDGLIADSKRYHWDVSGEKPVKGEDHTVDAATAFYASRAATLHGMVERAVAETEGDAA